MSVVTTPDNGPTRPTTFGILAAKNGDAQSTQTEPLGGEVVDRFGVPVRRWLPVALGTALVLDALIPLAAGTVRWVSLLVWAAVCVTVTGVRSRRRYVVLSPTALTIHDNAWLAWRLLRASSRPPNPRRIERPQIRSIDPLTVNTRTSLVVRTTDDALVVLPTPARMWWTYRGDQHFVAEAVRVQRWLEATVA